MTYVSPIPDPLSTPLSDHKCPLCERPCYPPRFDGGSWCHGDQEHGVGCQAILKVDDRKIVLIARRFRLQGRKA